MLGTPFAASFTLPSPILEKQGPARCVKEEEINPSCHCTGRDWKKHMFYGERPRSPLYQPLKPGTTLNPRVPSPPPHQVVVLLIIAHEIILHVRHLGRDGGREGGETGDNLLPQSSTTQRRHSQLLLAFPSVLEELNVSSRNECAAYRGGSLRRQKGVHCPHFLRVGWCLSN